MNIGMYRPYKVFVSKDVTVDATSLADLDNGELAVLKADGSLMTAGDTLADSPWFYIAQGTATLGKPILSNRIKGTGVTKWLGKSYVAKAEQTSYIGYNGTTTSYAVTVAGIDTGEVLKLAINFPFDKSLRSLRTWNRSFQYTATADNTGDVAVKNLVAQITKDQVCKDFITAYAIGDGSGGATTIVVNGVTINIVNMTSPTNVGIKLVGKALDHSAYDNHDQVTFECFLDGDWETATAVDQFGFIEAAAGKTTTNKASVSPSKGIGTYDLVLDMERFALGFWGHSNRTLFPVITPDTYALSTEAYDIYCIEWTDSVQANDLTWNQNMNQVIIAIPYDAAAVNGTAFEAVMNPYMASCPGAFDNVTL